MRLIERHLGRELLLGMALALLVVVGMDALLAFIKELNDIGQGRYGFWQIAQYVVMTLPRRLQEAMPVAVLLGGLLGLGQLAAGSELVVLRAAGVSRLRLILALFKVGALLVALSFLWGEFVVPASEQYAQSERALAKSGGALLQGRYGLWAREGDAFIHIRHLDASGGMNDVTIFGFDDQGRLVEASHAGRAVPEEKAWRLQNVARSRISAAGVVAERTSQQQRASLLGPDLLNVVVTGPAYLSARDLFQYIRFLRGNGLDARPYELAFWNRVVSPFNILVMLVFVVPFVLGPLRHSGAGQRMMAGVLLGVVFYLLTRTYYQIGQVYALNPLLSSLLPGLLYLAVALVLLRRTP